MSKDWTYFVKDVEDFKKRGLCSYYGILIDGVNPYTKETISDYINNGYTILNEIDFEALVEEHNNSICGNWCEISEEFYEQQMNVLPPMYYHDGGFFISEAETADIHGFYQKLNGKYYTSLQRLGSCRDNILLSLRCAISNNLVENRVDN